MLKNLLAPLMLASTLAGAQVPPADRRPPVDVAALLGLDSARAAMEAIHTQTDQQLAAVLTPDELAKLHDAMRADRPPRRVPPQASS